MLLMVVVASLIAMQVYMKRGVSGRMRAAADAIGEQYAPKATTGLSTLSFTSSSTTTQVFEEDQQVDDQTVDVVVTTTTLTEPEVTTRTSTETVGPLENQLFE